MDIRLGGGVSIEMCGSFYQVEASLEGLNLTTVYEMKSDDSYEEM